MVVLHNNSLALRVWEQNALLGNPQYGCDIPSIDFAAVALGGGLRSWRVERSADAHDGLSLVDCMVDRYEAPYADKIVRAYDRGEPQSAWMARNLLRPERVRLSPALRHAEPDLRKHA